MGSLHPRVSKALLEVLVYVALGNRNHEVCYSQWPQTSRVPEVASHPQPERQHSNNGKENSLESDRLVQILTLAPSHLCDFKHMNEPICASVSFFIKWRQ